MAVKVWTHIRENGGWVLGCNEASVFLYSFLGAASSDTIRELKDHILQGKDPDSFENATPIMVSSSAVDRIEAGKTDLCLEIFYREGDERCLTCAGDMMTPGTMGGAIAHELASNSGRNVEESQKDMTLGAAIFVPSMVTGFAALFASGMYIATEGGGRGRGKGQFLNMIASALGPVLSLVLGLTPLAIGVLWIAKNMLVRPKILVVRFV